MGIQSIPAVIAFVNGQPADGFMGAVPESQVTAFIDKLTAGMPARRAQYRRNPERGRSRSGRGRSGHRRADLCRGAGGRRHQYRGAGGACEMLRGDRRDRAGQADARHGAGIEAQRRGGQGRAGLDRSRRAGQVARPGDRTGTESRRKPARSSGAIRSGDRAQRRRQARRGDRSSCSKSSSATANGTRTARASNWCSSSRRGAPTDEATVEGRKRLSTILFS